MYACFPYLDSLFTDALKICQELGPTPGAPGWSQTAKPVYNEQGMSMLLLWLSSDLELRINAAALYLAHPKIPGKEICV